MTAGLLLLWHAAGSFNSWLSVLEHLWAHQTKTTHLHPPPWLEHFKHLISSTAGRFGDASVQSKGDITHTPLRRPQVRSLPLHAGRKMSITLDTPKTSLVFLVITNPPSFLLPRNHLQCNTYTVKQNDCFLVLGTYLHTADFLPRLCSTVMWSLEKQSTNTL